MKTDGLSWLDNTLDIDMRVHAGGADSETPAFDETQFHEIWKTENRQPTSWESAPSYTWLQLPTDICRIIDSLVTRRTMMQLMPSVKMHMLCL